MLMRRAAKSAGVKHIVYPEQLWAPTWKKVQGIIMGSHIAEGILNELEGVAVTQPAPGLFLL